MLRKVRAAAAEYNMLPGGTLVLCAVSGGADSMCLLHVLQTLSVSDGFCLAAAHYNHGLRGEAAGADAAFVRAWCETRQIPFVLGEGDVAGQAKARGMGIEETARAMRYAFLEGTAAALGARRIATAHNADDNAETLLLHLVRGAGLRGLAGIPPRRQSVVRPLLTTGRAEIEAYLTRHGVPHVEDASNADMGFRRNRIRHQVMPLLREMNPDITAGMTRTLRALRADNDYLTAAAWRAASSARSDGDILVIPAADVAGQPDPVAARAVQRLLERAAGAPAGTAAQLEAIVALARGGDPSGTVHLPGGCLVRRDYERLLFEREEVPAQPFLPVPLACGENQPIPGTDWQVTCLPAVAPETPHGERDVYYLRLGADWPVLRPRAAGDRITLPHRPGKRLKELFIDAKLPRRLRERTPVLADEHGVLAVAGFGPEVCRLAAPGTSAYQIRFQKT